MAYYANAARLDSDRLLDLRRSEHRRRGLLLDLIGILLLSVLVIWAYVAAWLSDSDPNETVRLGASLAAGFVLGRVLSYVRLELAPACILLVAAILLLVAPAEFLSDKPASYPFGYVNAKGAFLVQAAAAALYLALAGNRGASRNVALAVGVILALVPFVIDSIAAGVLACCVVGGMFLPGQAARRSLTVFGALVAAVLVLTLALAGSHPIDRSGLVGEVTVLMRSEQRVALWHSAASLFANHPLRGVGPGNFEVISPIARAEEDVRWTPNIFLEQGAEAGTPGFALMVLLWGWGFVRLGSSPYTRCTVIAGAAWAALGIHACFDYVLHYSAVPITASAMLGVATHARFRNGDTRDEDPCAD